MIGQAARSTLLRALAYMLVLEIILVPAILFWPEFRDHIGDLKEKLPVPFLRNTLERIDSLENHLKVYAYVCAQQYFKAGTTIGTLASVLFAMGAVAGEVHRGTLEVWLARPIPRWRILLERWLAGALAVCLPIYLTSSTIPYLLEKVGESVEQWKLFLCSTYQCLGLLVVYSATFLLSTFMRRPITVGFVMLLFTAAELAVYFVKTATHWSLYRALDIEEFLRICRLEELPLGLSLGMGGLTLGLLITSLLVFERRTP